MMSVGSGSRLRPVVTPASKLLLKASLTSKTARSPHGWPGPSISLTKARAARARSARPPGKRHAVPDRHPGHHRTRPSLPAPAPGKYPGRPAGTHGCTLDSAPCVKPGQSARAPVRGRPSKRRRCAPTVGTMHADRRSCADRPT